MPHYKDRYKITIMGCGNSAGTPTIGNYWGNCDPSNPKNRRMRPSVAIQSGDKSLIIDTGADFKEQINLYNIDNIRGVLYTHAHSDHVAGIDELRVLRLRNKEHINVYSIADTIDELERRFDYMFVQKAKIYPQVLKSNILTNDDLNLTTDIDGIKFIPFEQDHGTCRSLGFRFGDLAYSTDMVRLPERSFEVLQGIKTWVVDAAGYKMESNLVHATLRDVIDMNDRIGAEKIYLTHLSPLMDYDRLMNELPEGFEPAYDGLTFDVDV